MYARLARGLSLDALQKIFWDQGIDITPANPLLGQANYLACERDHPSSS